MIGLFLVAALAAQADPLAPLSAYQGAWGARIEELDSPYGKASTTRVTIRNDCRRAGAFYACAQNVDGKDGALVVFTWNAATVSYASYPLLPGPPADIHPGVLKIEGNTWYFPWDQLVEGKTVHFRVVNRFLDPNTIEFRKEVSQDGAAWTVIGRGLEKRLSN